MAANASFVRGCGLKGEAELIRKTDLDVWPRHLAEGYRRDERQVMQHGKPIVNKLELSKNAKGGLDWFGTTEIAFRTGHYDHGHFNRYFSKQMRQSATQYRNAQRAAKRG